MEIQEITLSDNAIKGIRALREMESEGTSHEKFFFNVLTFISNEMTGARDPEKNQVFRDYFDTISYYSGIITSLVEE